MTTDLISIDTLKTLNLNIDFKISKNDILDIMIEQLRENLEEKVKVLKEDYEHSCEEFIKYEIEQSTKYETEQLKKLENDPKVQAVVKSFKDFSGNPVKIGKMYGYYILHIKQNFIDETNNLYSYYFKCKDFNDVIRIAKYVPYKETEAVKEKREICNNKKSAYYTAKNELNAFLHSKDKMRVAVLKQFLAGTEEGSKLLDLINKSRTGKQLIKAINKTDQ